MLRTTVLLAALLVLPSAIPGAGDAPLDRATLRGLKSVSVVIDRLTPDLQRDGLSPERLQRQIEERLSKAGIIIDKDAVEFIGFRVLAIREKKAPYSLWFAIGLYQPVLLSRDKNIRTATQTWEAETAVTATPKLLVRSSAAIVDQLADQFVAAYRSVNPPNSGTGYEIPK